MVRQAHHERLFIILHESCKVDKTDNVDKVGKKIHSLLIALTVLSTFAFALDTDPFPGKQAPDFTLPSIDGKSVNLKELYDKGPVWLTLFTTWCPGCDDEAPLLVEACKKNPEIQFLAVSLEEDVSDVRKFQKKFQVPYPIALDNSGAITQAYQIRPIPVNIGIEQGGKILFRRQLIEAIDLPILLGALSPQARPVQTPPDQGQRGVLKKLFSSVPLLASFLAGILTFLSPCVLPLIPAYIAFITGFGLDKLMAGGNPADIRKSLLLSTAVFVLGFGSVFTALGATASVLGQALTGVQTWIRAIGGGMMIAFGLHLAGILSIMPLYREMRFQFKNEKAGLLGAYLMGIVFAAGWTPCVGPILSAILVYSASEATLAKGVALLICYSAGIGVPFLLASAFLPQFQKFLNRIKPHFPAIEIASGALLIVLGILLITNKFAFIAGVMPGI